MLLKVRLKIKDFLLLIAFIFLTNSLFASFIFIPMDAELQENHLKAYGITYWSLEKGYKAQWLLNYQGGSFLIENTPQIENECKIRGVSYQVISDLQAEKILLEISSPSENMEAVLLEKAPKIAVYSPKDKLPWDDAVT
ncbi:MAG: hypothetical protein ACI848_001547, partial [Roseivirga sp.]